MTLWKVNGENWMIDNRVVTKEEAEIQIEINTQIFNDECAGKIVDYSKRHTVTRFSKGE